MALLCIHAARLCGVFRTIFLLSVWSLSRKKKQTIIINNLIHGGGGGGGLGTLEEIMFYMGTQNGLKLDILT